jgi:hypothetical protein
VCLNFCTGLLLEPGWCKYDVRKTKAGGGLFLALKPI